MKLTKLRPAKRNPRKITDDALNKLAQSIARDPQFMELRPIVHDAGGVIIGGNQRYRAIKEILGKSEIPDSWAIEAKDLTPEQARRFQLVDNAPEGMAGAWDIDLLGADWDLPELADLGFDLSMFELDDIQESPKDKADVNQSNIYGEELKYQILVTCETEQDQVEIMEYLQAKGVLCKPLIL